jgi:putative hydrolase of the HAD superfamily
MSSNPQSAIGNPQFKAIVFDAVGTLLYADPPVAEIYRLAAEHRGITLSREEIRRRFALALAKFAARGEATSHEREIARWRAIVAAVIPEAADVGPIFQQLFDHFAQPSAWKLFDDVQPAWRALQQQGFMLGVASNYDDRLGAVCRGFDILQECPHVYWASAVGFTKPHPDFFSRIARRLAVAPHEVLMIGDELENDILAARVAGWQALHLSRDGSVASSLSSLAELRTLLATRTPD